MTARDPALTRRRADERASVLVVAHGVWRTFSLPSPRRGTQPGTASSTAPGCEALPTLDENRTTGGADVSLPPAPDGATQTCIVDGALAQEDSAGRTEILRAGEFQPMTLGQGVRCDEGNGPQTERVHSLRLSYRPAAEGIDDMREIELLLIDLHRPAPGRGGGR